MRKYSLLKRARRVVLSGANAIATIIETVERRQAGFNTDVALRAAVRNGVRRAAVLERASEGYRDEVDTNLSVFASSLSSEQLHGIADELCLRLNVQQACALVSLIKVSLMAQKAGATR